MIKLFRCRSLIRFNKQYEVQCYWFCVDRKQPVVPYQELMIDYDPNIEGIEIAERGVNDFFTEQEIETLEDYLATKEIGLEIWKAEVFPVKSTYVGLGDAPLGGGAGNIKLSEFEGYSLPFKVWGFYDSKDLEDMVYSPVE